MVHIQLVFGPTCAEPIYVDWRRYRVVNSLLCRDNPLCVLIIPRNMSTQRFSSRLELLSRMLDIFETDLIQVSLTVNALLLVRVSYRPSILTLTHFTDFWTPYLWAHYRFILCTIHMPNVSCFKGQCNSGFMHGYYLRVVHDKEIRHLDTALLAIIRP